MPNATPPLARAEDHHAAHRPEPRNEVVLPDIGDLASRLRFCPQDGRIWLDERRMILLHVSAFASLRRELIDSLGIETARGLLTRMGYESGSTDAKFARRVRANQSATEAFLVGPQLHSLEGIVRVVPVTLDFDIANGHYYGEFLWFDSSEADAHIGTYGLGSEPVCWTQIGYACGYTSTFMGRPILYREIECRATGHSHCRIIGKPFEEWDDVDRDLAKFQPEAFANRYDLGKAAGRTAAAPDTAKRQPHFGDLLVGASSAFVAACHMLQKVARTRATVLFLGETGVGKEMFARTLHSISDRADKPFVSLNCAAIPENLVEAELFGVERGAYTGAVESRPGRFERADGGTLFLDEVGSLNLAAQGKLLRALQEGEIERVGGKQVKKVDVRVIAATNVDLNAAVKEGRFRSDLIYRLNVFPIRVPPLRERRDDIPHLMNHFLRKFAARHGKTVTGFTPRAIDALLDHDYPGNIRELENMIERAVILTADGGPIEAAHLFAGDDSASGQHLGLGRDGNLRRELGLRGAAEGAAPGEATDLVNRVLSGKWTLEKIENHLIEAAVAKADGNLSQAARMLGMTRAQLAYRHAKLHELSPT
jgi:two-component system response regulator HydG